MSFLLMTRKRESGTTDMRVRMSTERMKVGSKKYSELKYPLPSHVSMTTMANAYTRNDRNWR